MSKPNTITIDEVEYVRADSVRPAPAACDDGYVIVRCCNAGVHAGYLVGRGDGVVTLKRARRLWSWWSKFTLSGLATEGPLKSRMSDQMYSCEVPIIDLTESDVCEVIYCTDRARDAIIAVKEHANA